jgi:glycosyltransferase involved in cell wall biosynthesis
MDVRKKVLYITYDGLTDPLGQSQILPYLKGLAPYGYDFTILSFEKKDRFQKDKNLIQQLTSESGIMWVPLIFSTKPPLLSKFYDAIRMKSRAVELHKAKNFDMVHCRSYVAADVGLYMKKRFGVPFFFDMRGFWADEKKDGSWNVSNPLYKRIYNYYKRKEAEYLEHADYIISLTEAGKKEMSTWPAFNKKVPLEVIPCCTDMDHFSLTDPVQKKQAREKLGIGKEDFLLSYLGNIGTWYMINEMLGFFKQLKEHYPSAKFLVITHTPKEVVIEKIRSLELSEKDFIITQVPRKDVPALVKASDINISFIKPVFSKISSSPTKLGEVLSMGIPVICNSGVGDVKQIVENADAGYVIDNFEKEDFEKAIMAIPRLMEKNPSSIRNAIENIYSLDKGIQSYLSAYRKVLKKENELLPEGEFN